MDSLTWLLVGHLVGDWLLQNDWMAKGKKQGLVTLAGMIHFAVYTVAILGAIWLSKPKNQDPITYLMLGIFIFVTHWLIDTTSLVENWMRLYGQSNSIMVRVMVDQTFHMIVLAFIAYTVH